MNKIQSENKISIIITAYNSASYIADSVDSAIKQTYSNWELIIINDGSTDNTDHVIKEMTRKDKRIKYYSNHINIGFVQSLNKGIKLSKGEFIARLDSDDVWLDDRKLEKQMDYILKNPEIVLIGTWGYKLDSNGNQAAKLEYPVRDIDIRKYLLIENCFIHSSVVFKKDLAVKSGGYEVKFNSAEDYALWLKLGQLGKLYNLPEHMVGYRTNTMGISMTKYDEQIVNTIKAIHQFHNNYPFYFLALPLWYARKMIPRSTRENISSLSRKLIISIFKSNEKHQK